MAQITHKDPPLSAQLSGLFLPDFCEKGNLLIIILVSELVAMVLAIAQPGTFMDRLSYLALVSLFIQWIALSSISIMCSLQTFLRRMNNVQAALISFGLIQTLTILFTLLSYGITLFTGIAASLQKDWLLDSLLSNLLVSMIITAIALRYLYIQHQSKLHIEAEARSRIRALQARIRPHFLFNSMNIIASLTRSDPVLAEQAVEDLSELFRASLSSSESLNLEDELELARSYLRIESLRLGSRLRVIWDIDEQAYNLNLPALSIQPLVENAVYHGIEPLPKGGTIRITAKKHQQCIRIEISNPVPEDDKSKARSGNRIAQDNVRQRFALAFDNRGKMSIQLKNNHYRVTLEAPVEERVKL